MRHATIEVYRWGHSWVAHRPDEPGHDCLEDDGDASPDRLPQHHGVADTETGAVRRLLRAETLHP